MIDTLPAVERFESNTGARIYRIPCEAFPDFVAYCYLVLEAGPPTLIDTGSGYGYSNSQIVDAIGRLKADFGEPVALTDVRRIVITHGHIDHFGGLSHLVQLIEPEVAVHELDRRVLTAYEERVVVATKALRVFLQWAGVSADFQQDLMQMYSFSKKHTSSVSVDITLSDGQVLDGLRFIHTPGHCPGQVCIEIGDVLLSADHILAETTPHQAPESITAYTGLGHYLEALAKVRSLGGFDLALGGHESPIRDVYKRIDQIKKSHDRKLERVLQVTRDAPGPVTVSDISKLMYPTVRGFNILLALEEVGAHVEYLYQRGYLAVTNVDQVEREENPALLYEVL